ncbi:MAG: hypothetical protein AUG07_04140 [Acidobacteria bacterium 13_1_20CM_2_60_10]|nr:MAG: hypothetical protein AUG07_04140 [Acidobacteria bacterium 13_1_20CM_2_60_10]PYU05025.1 MAG: hypothetical protein DMG33_12300 [Acidobacteriota bacterium]
MGNGEQDSRQLERRRAARFPCRLDLEMEWGSAVLRGRIRDLSANGAFIELPDPLWIGAGFTARLELGGPVQIDCFVRRVEPGRGMGVSVNVARPENRERFQELVERLSQVVPPGAK